MGGLADIVCMGVAGSWGEQGATAPSAVNPGSVNGQDGSKGFFTCSCAGTAGNGQPGASATVVGAAGGAGGWGGAAPNLSLTIGQIQVTGGANVLTVAGVGGVGGTGGTGGNGGSGAPGGNAGQDPTACQTASEWLANSPCPVTVGGTGGNGTAAGNGGTGGTGGTGPTIVIYYTQANKPNLQSDMSVGANPGAGGGGGGGGGAGIGGPGGRNEVIQNKPVTYAANGQTGSNTAVAGTGGASGGPGYVQWVQLPSS
jgi:hypothetical protein